FPPASSVGLAQGHNWHRWNLHLLSSCGSVFINHRSENSESLLRCVAFTDS
ncbi:hypothetical protein KUCAC02_032690, partial [Chaenocephalus aceratus]